MKKNLVVLLASVALVAAVVLLIGGTFSTKTWAEDPPEGMDAGYLSQSSHVSNRERPVKPLKADSEANQVLSAEPILPAGDSKALSLNSLSSTPPEGVNARNISRHGAKVKTVPCPGCNRKSNEILSFTNRAELSSSSFNNAAIQLIEAKDARLNNSGGRALYRPFSTMAVGDSCTNPFPVPSIPFSDSGNTCGFNNDYDVACPYTGSTSPDVVYAYTAIETICVDITLCTGITYYDTKLYVFEDICGDTLFLVDCNDDFCGDPFSFVSELQGLQFNPGHTYYIIIDGYGGDCGNYTIEITETECPQPPLPLVCPLNTIYGQTPISPEGGWSAATSEENPGYIIYDDFHGITAPICDIHFWGLVLACCWTNCEEDPMPFLITFYEDTGAPGNIVCTYAETLNMVNTWNTYSGYYLYEFNAEFDECCELDSGWVSIMGQGDTTCWFLWMSGSGPNSFCYQLQSGVLVERYYDQAFCLTEAIVFPGDTCGYPIEINLPGSLPFIDLFQTTCGRINDYDSTCLSPYDGGEDIIYRLNVTVPISIDIMVDPLGTPWTGFSLDSICPPDSDCIVVSTNPTGSPYRERNIDLVPGTYYLMIDTWPFPDCIPSFHLEVKESGPCFPDFVMTAPDTVLGSLCEARNDCDLMPSEEHIFQVILPFGAYWTFSTCGSSFDTWIALSRECCFYELGVNDDAEACSSQSQISMYLEADTYFVVIESHYEDSCGEYVFSVYPCQVICPATAILEDEPVCSVGYVDNHNGGCNSSPPVFFPIDIGDTVCAQSGAWGSRDTDWFELVLLNSGVLTWTVVAEFPVSMGLVPTDPPGIPDCGAILGTIDPWGTAEPCIEVSVTTPYLQPGIYWFFVAPQVFDGIECGSQYLASITYENPGDSCENPIEITLPAMLPFFDNDQTTAGRVNNYWGTCLAPYDAGEDIIYELTVTTDLIVDIIMRTDSAGTGFLIDTVCPPGASCLYSVATAMAGGCSLMTYSLRAGTYYLMIDSDPSISRLMMDDPISINTTFDLEIRGIACVPDYIVTAPDTIIDTTCGEGDDCGLRNTEDHIIEVIIPYAGYWDFSLCDSDRDFDTWIALGSYCCSNDIAINDDFCDLHSFIREYLEAGTYYLTIEGYDTCGAYVLYIEEFIPPDHCPPGAIYSQSYHGTLETEAAAYTSDSYFPYTVFDDFSGVTEPICGISFWGFDDYFDTGWYECFSDTMLFSIVFYNDTNGYPGDTQCAYTLPIVAEPEGETFFGMFELNHYLTYFEPCCSTDNGWVSIQGADGDSCVFLWLSGYGPNEFSYQNDGYGYSILDVDLAFCLLPSPGDNCESPFVIHGIPFSDTGNTCGFNDDYDEVCPYTGSTAPDVVYRYSPSENICINLTLCTGITDFDAKMYIYEDSCGSAPIACNDDACSSDSFTSAFLPELLGIYLTAGLDYYIVVDGYGDTCGNYTIEITECPPCVICPVTAIPEPEPCGDDSNSGCDNPTASLYTQIFCEDTFCATTWADGGARDADWYWFTPTAGTTYTHISLVTEIPLWLYLYDITEGCDSLRVIDSLLTTNCDTVLMVDSLYFPATEFVIVVFPDILYDYPCPNLYMLSLHCEYPPTCFPDFSVTAPGTWENSTCSAGDDCNPGTPALQSEDHIYEVEIPCDGEWTFSLCGSSYDTKIAVFEECCSLLIAYNDDYCGLQSEVVWTLVAGYYYVVVDGYSTNCGDYILNINRGQGDNCDNPITIFLPSDLPYADFNQSTCCRVNDYDSTCLGYYDGGEDIIYELVVTSPIVVNITMDPYSSTWSGILIDTLCPPGETCLNILTGSTAAPRVWQRMLLTPDTYYLMIDTWPSPTCIDSFDLFIEEWECIQECPVTAILEPEPCGDDSNGGCDNAIDPRFTPVFCGDTICGSAWADAGFRDTDWYQFFTAESIIVIWSVYADFPVVTYLYDGNFGCPPMPPMAADTGLVCDTLVIVDTIAPGIYWFYIAPDTLFEYPCINDYVASLGCLPWSPCVADFFIIAPDTVTDSTCGAGNHCDLQITEDHIHKVFIPYTGYWLFSLCGSSYDTWMALGTECCWDDIAINDDACGLQSEILANLIADTYYVDIEGYSSCGNYELIIVPVDTCIPDFVVTAPGVWEDSTCGAIDNCDPNSMMYAEDHIYEVNIPCDGEWTFSL
ncbi:hypothetical protein JW877_02895, partial [bacterium]|nr:hypothetical protein [bacterium]